MRTVFLTGASGYIGGSVARKLVAAGHRVLGLTRSTENAAKLREQGIEAVVGSLDDAALLVSSAREADLVINAADSDHRAAAEAMLAALEGTGKTFIHTSGTSIVADYAGGEYGAKTYDEATPIYPCPEKLARYGVDLFVLSTRYRNVRSLVICNSLIYGRGAGLHAESIQLPILIQKAREAHAGIHVGPGENLWSNVHIDDVVDLYLLAIENGPPGTFYFAENGEATFKDVAAAIARGLGFGGRTRSWPVADAVRECGFARGMLSLGSNVRVRGVDARTVLHWAPRHSAMVAEVERDLAGA